MSKKQFELNHDDEVALKADFDLNQSGQPTAPYVSSLFTRDDTSGEVQNSALEGAIDYNLTGSGQSPMNRSVTVLDATSAGVTITLPTIGVGITDLEYWVVMGETTQSVSVPASVQWKDGKAPVDSDYKANSTHVFHFTAKKPDAATTEVITGVMGVFATPAE